MKELKGIKLVVGYLFLALMFLVALACFVVLSPFILMMYICEFIKRGLIWVWSLIAESADVAADHFFDIITKIYVKYFFKPEALKSDEE